jgi:hypothetical protein
LALRPFTIALKMRKPPPSNPPAMSESAIPHSVPAPAEEVNSSPPRLGSRPRSAPRPETP